MAPRRSLLALTLLALVVLAGCTGSFDPSTLDGEPKPVTTPADDRTAAATTDTATGTNATPPAVHANPWGADPVVVAIDNRDEPGRDFAPQLRETTEFWETNAAQYAGYAVEYDVRPNADDPDIVVTFVASVPACGAEHDGGAAGCAPVITDSRQIDRPERVWVSTGLSDDSTTLVLKHEFGHTLGLGHDDEPQDVMRAAGVLYTQPAPNATERAFPWRDGEFSVAIDTGDEPSPARAQVDHALAYYEDDPPGMPTNLSITVVDAATDAEILIRLDDSACGGSGSCIQTFGPDLDGDGAIEEYTRVEISLAGIDTDAIGWHVGYWLAFAFGAEDDDDKPPPFRDASYRERRSDWWNQG